MGLRSTASRMFAAPTLALLEASLRDLVEEALDARAFVTEGEVRAVQTSIEALRRDLATRRAELDALRQAVDAFSLDLTDDLGLVEPDEVDASVSRLEAARDGLQRSIDRTEGALRATTKQLHELHDGLHRLGLRVDKVQQVATAARNTAEAAAEGLVELEQAAPQ
jgi:predicted  nucleic acid-binding Zn-ribbon protein